MNQNKKLAATSQGFSSLNKENDNMERKENEKVETEKQIK